MWYKVASIGAMADGKPIKVLAGGEKLMLIKKAEKVFAVSAICSHEDKELLNGRFVEEEWECPHHGGRFDLATGRATHMPIVAPITSFPVRVDDGQVFVEVD